MSSSWPRSGWPARKSRGNHALTISALRSSANDRLVPPVPDFPRVAPSCVQPVSRTLPGAAAAADRRICGRRIRRAASSISSRCRRASPAPRRMARRSGSSTSTRRSALVPAGARHGRRDALAASGDAGRRHAGAGAAAGTTRRPQRYRHGRLRARCPGRAARRGTGRAALCTGLRRRGLGAEARTGRAVLRRGGDRHAAHHRRHRRDVDQFLQESLQRHGRGGDLRRRRARGAIRRRRGRYAATASLAPGWADRAESSTQLGIPLYGAPPTGLRPRHLVPGRGASPAPSPRC